VVRIRAWDHGALERLLRYCARPPFALDRLEAIDDDHVRYQLSNPPAVSPARRPPTWEDAPTEVDPGYDPIAQREPVVEFDEIV
jgi:hypothetical protein